MTMFYTDGAQFTYMPEDVPGCKFVWEGGPYIDVIDTDRQEAVDCINVWDYENDKPNIPVTVDGFRSECDRWLAEAFEE